MPRKSIIKCLPSSFRKELDRLILEDKLSIDQLRAFIAGCEAAEKIPCRSAVGDYAKEVKDTAAMLLESREIAKGIAQELGPGSVEGEQGRLLVEMLRTFFFRFIRSRTTDPDATFDSDEFAKMARALRDMSQAMHLEQDFAKRIREEERKKVEAEMKTRVQQLGSAQDLKKLTDDELEKKIAELTARAA